MDRYGSTLGASASSSASATTKTSSTSSTTSKKHWIGKNVRLFGLQAHPHLNGQTGVATGVDARGQVAICLDSNKTTVKCLPKFLHENLTGDSSDLLRASKLVQQQNRERIEEQRRQQYERLMKSPQSASPTSTQRQSAVSTRQAEEAQSIAEDEKLIDPEDPSANVYRSLLEWSRSQTGAVHATIRSFVKGGAQGELKLSALGLPPKILLLISQLPRIDSLDCSRNRLAMLPAEVCAMKGLQQLIWSENSIVRLPLDIGRLRKLTKLSLRANRLDFLPSEIGNVVALEELDLYGNQLAVLPEELGFLENLRTLVCGKNNFSELPRSLYRLTLLQKLDCSDNVFRRIPPAVCRLSSLEVLDFSRNEVEALPVQLGLGGKLRTISLTKNRCQIGIEISMLRQLNQDCRIDLKGAKDVIIHDQSQSASVCWTRLPQWVYEDAKNGNAQALISYVEEFSGAKLVPPRHVRVMLVGNAGAGKTTLAELLRGRTIAERLRRYVLGVADRRDITFGIDVAEWEVSKELSFTLWDFAGQPEYQPTHQLFMADDAIYILVFNAKAAMEGGFSGQEATIKYLETWTDLISTRARDASVLLVGTHADALSSVERVELLKVVGPFAYNKTNQVQFVKRTLFLIDALQRNTSGELDQACVETGLAIVRKRQNVPKKLLQLRNALRRHSTSKPIMSMEEFKTYSQEHFGIKWSMLASTLRTWGWIENFHEVAELADVVFLDPQWLAKMMACVVTRLSRERPGGIVTRDELRKAWRDQPSAMSPSVQDTLISVMQAFQLAHATSADRFVIPAVLASFEHSSVQSALHDSDAGIQLKAAKADGSLLDSVRYSLSHFPPGFMGRLFVLLYSSQLISAVGYQGGMLVRINREGFPESLHVRITRYQTIEVDSTSEYSCQIFEERMLFLIENFYKNNVRIYRNGQEIACELSRDGQRRVVEAPREPIRFDPTEDIIRGKLLGEGSFGKVWEVEGSGRNRALGRGSFAMKEKAANCGVDDSSEFVTEFTVMKQLVSCQYAVSVEGYFGEQGPNGLVVTHILMPKYESSLKEFLKKRYEELGTTFATLGWFDDDEVVEWSTKIILGLRYMHRLRMAHLDIKPDNILVRTKGLCNLSTLALADFGTVLMNARSSGEESGAVLTAMRGTAGYIAPELLQASREAPCCDALAADIYSFGMLVSVMVSGLLPKGQSDALSSGSSVRPPVGDSNAWDSLRGLISSCCNTDDKKRKSAAALVDLRLDVGVQEANFSATEPGTNTAFLSGPVEAGELTISVQKLEVEQLHAQNEQSPSDVRQIIPSPVASSKPLSATNLEPHDKKPLLNKPDGSVPNWVPDEEAHFCATCAANFTLIRRRHHCRNCGNLICNSCSRFRLKVDRIGTNKNSRVCTACFESLNGVATLASGNGSSDDRIAAENTENLSHARPNSESAFRSDSVIIEPSSAGNAITIETSLPDDMASETTILSPSSIVAESMQDWCRKNGISHVYDKHSGRLQNFVVTKLFHRKYEHLLQILEGDSTAADELWEVLASFRHGSFTAAESISYSSPGIGKAMASEPTIPPPSSIVADSMQDWCREHGISHVYDKHSGRLKGFVAAKLLHRKYEHLVQILEGDFHGADQLSAVLASLESDSSTAKSNAPGASTKSAVPPEQATKAAAAAAADDDIATAADQDAANQPVAHAARV